MREIRAYAWITAASSALAMSGGNVNRAVKAADELLKEFDSRMDRWEAEEERGREARLKARRESEELGKRMAEETNGKA